VWGRVFLVVVVSSSITLQVFQTSSDHALLLMMASHYARETIEGQTKKGVERSRRQEYMREKKGWRVREQDICTKKAKSTEQMYAPKRSRGP